MVSRLLVAACLVSLTAPAEPALKDIYKDAFLVGAALNPAYFEERDAAGAALVKEQFDTITPENVLKWQVVHPKLGVYNFGPADAFVAFGEKNHMFVVGHTLVWHQQTPAWVFQDEQGKPLTRDALLARMKEHIQTVVGRYKGRVNAWDVVNEALEEDGSLRQTPYLKIIGEDYIAKAFQFAHEADPKAILNYNEYSIENEPKRKGAIALIKKLRDEGVPVDIVGIQGHYKLDWPSAALVDATISDFAKAGVKVAFTELDIDVLPRATASNAADVSLSAEAKAQLNPYAAGLPADVEKALTDRYAGLFQVFYKHKGEVTRVTFWGVTDRSSWLNNWPVRGRTNYPLLFDRNYRTKPAFDAVVKVPKG